MEARQSAASILSNEQIQVLITGKFGDGNFATNSKAKYHPEKSYNYHYGTNCIHKEYIEFKYKLLGNLCKNQITSITNKGYKENLIHRFNTCSCPEITAIAVESAKKTLYRMDELGLALWFFDDGSLHKTKLFYNLNTQKFSKEFQESVIIPFLYNKFGIKGILTSEKKKDGREFWYLRIRKFEGAFYISELLRKYNLNCFNYKCISSETIQKWSKLQEELKSRDIDIYSLKHRTISNLMKKISI